jgi:hypothetical protein
MHFLNPDLGSLGRAWTSRQFFCLGRTVNIALIFNDTAGQAASNLNEAMIG